MLENKVMKVPSGVWNRHGTRLHATNSIYSESHQWQEVRVMSKAVIHSLSSRKRERKYQRQTCILKAKESKFIPSPFSVPLLKKA
jgi:hypothetical protein